MCLDIQICEVIFVYVVIGLIVGWKFWIFNVLNDVFRYVKFDFGEVYVEYLSKEVDV